MKRHAFIERMAGRRLAGRRLFVVTAAVAMLLGGALAAVVALTSGPSTYRIEAEFASAPGLFAGAPVEMLGVQIGTVTAVKADPGHVLVTMGIDSGRPVPRGADAALTSVELLNEPDVVLVPGYSGGPRMRPSSVIPESHTAVPVSTERLLEELQTVLRQVNPKSVGGLVHNLALDLGGQGKELQRLISGAAGTLQVLAQKGNDLGRLDGSLASVMKTLRADSTNLVQLITDYDTVSSVIASNDSALGQGLANLDAASKQLVDLLAPNLAPLEKEVPVVTTVGRTLDRNLSSLDELLASAVKLFSGAERAYVPQYKWLNLNNQLPPGMTGAYVAGLIGDRLAGICRRLLANHSAGLSVAEIATLKTCGNPDSGFFDPILGLVPKILDSLPGGGNATSLPNLSGVSASPATSASSVFEKGLGEIPGLSNAEKAALEHGASSPPSSGSRATAQGGPSSGSSRASSAPSGSTRSGGNGASPSGGKQITIKTPLLNLSLSADRDLPSIARLPGAARRPGGVSGFFDQVAHAVSSALSSAAHALSRGFEVIGGWL